MWCSHDLVMFHHNCVVLRRSFEVFVDLYKKVLRQLQISSAELAEKGAIVISQGVRKQLLMFGPYVFI